jgi:hypothetical protein
MTKFELTMFSVACTLLSGAAPLVAQIQGGWTVSGSMATARESGAAVQLGQGALVMGGSNGTMSLASAEIYNPVTGTWQVTGSMAEARMLFPAVVLQNRKVLVEGGSTTSSVVASAELYDPVTGTWSSAGSLTVQRYDHSATLLQDGKVLVTGGCTTTACPFSAQTGVSELYDPATNLWTTVGNLNTPREGHTATLLNNGQVLVVGGAVPVVTTSSELYDPTTGTWSVAPGIGTRYLHAATLLPDGTVLITGGTWSNTAFYETALYDPVANAWRSTGFMNAAHFSHTATLLSDGTVLVAGGAGAWLACGHRCLIPDPTVLAEIYNPATKTFTRTGNLSQGRANQTAALLTNGHLLTEGGVDVKPNSSNQVFLNSAEFYVPLTLSISTYSLNFSFEEVDRTSPMQTVSVANASNRTVNFTSISASGDYAETNSCPSILTLGQSCSINVTFTPTVPGTRNGAVTLVDDSLASPSQTISLTGIGEGNAISFSPASVNFGNQSANFSSKPVSVLLVNDGTGTVNISKIAFSRVGKTYTETNNCPATLTPHQSCTLQIVFTPPDVGTYREALLVTDNAAGSPQRLPLSGVGTPN